MFSRGEATYAKPLQSLMKGRKSAKKCLFLRCVDFSFAVFALEGDVKNSIASAQRQ